MERRAGTCQRNGSQQAVLAQGAQSEGCFAVPASPPGVGKELWRCAQADAGPALHA